MKHREVTIITDLQFGSCGKGLLAGYLAMMQQPDAIVTAWAPNAGHTYIDADGNKMVNIAVPNGIVSPSVKHVFIGPGSVINPEILESEIKRYWLPTMQPTSNKGAVIHAPLTRAEIHIHEHAAVVSERHRELEAGYAHKIGSTMKGAGEAVIEKMRRHPVEGASSPCPNIAAHALPQSLRKYVVSVEDYNDLLDQCFNVQIEGAQGFSLGINQGFYPYVTSRECTVHQLLSDCAIPHGFGLQYRVGVCRTYPIRVNNRDHWSGPGYPDQKEMDWGDIGVQPELTTVTRLPRRLFTFSKQQIAQAIRMNNIDHVFLNFANYMDGYPGLLNRVIGQIEEYAPVKWVGWGPKASDIRERAEYMFKSRD